MSFMNDPYLFQTQIGEGGERAQAFQSKAERAAKKRVTASFPGLHPGLQRVRPSGA